MSNCGEMMSGSWVVHSSRFKVVRICVNFLQNFVFGLGVHFMPRVAVIAPFTRILVELSITRVSVVVVI